MKKIVFLTGTRADFGKIKSLIQMLDCRRELEVHIFVTGMHMLRKYGYTYIEVENCNFKNIYKHINQNKSDTMDSVLAKTVAGFSDFVKEISPDMIVVHGDRIEALAGAIVGSLNNILVSHIEGGELSGTIDGLIRHAVSKMSHLHFVANKEAKKRLMQLGEVEESIFIIGSPDMDILSSPDLPVLEEVKRRYEIDFDNYAILLFHPVTTELDLMRHHARVVVDTVLEDTNNYVVIYPNNDAGNEAIIYEYQRLENNERFRVFPSMRFEYFLTLLKNALFILGNSSAAIREAPFYGLPGINIGTRQKGRVVSPAIIDVDYDKGELKKAIHDALHKVVEPVAMFGEGKSDELFSEILLKGNVWETSRQKYFVDL
jgi:UDP-N-acetylglucosamine 2-epimerase (hydrolysing)